MEGNNEQIKAKLSEMEDRYATLLANDAPDRELAELWFRIRELRKQLHGIQSGVLARS